MCTFAPTLAMESVPSLNELLHAVVAAGLDESTPRSSKHVQRLEHDTAPLHRIGIALMKALLYEHTKLIGYESLPTIAEEPTMPLNHYTWQEIGRQLLWGLACRDIGMLDQDIILNVRSRGTQHSMDMADRRAIKLLKQRLQLLYPSAKKPLLSVGGSSCFDRGFIVHIPAPSVYMTSQTSWQTLLRGIAELRGDAVPRVRELIMRAMEVAPDPSMKQALHSCLWDSSERVRPLSKSAEMALSLVARPPKAATMGNDGPAASSDECLRQQEAEPLELQDIGVPTRRLVENAMLHVRAIAENIPDPEALRLATTAATTVDDDEEFFGSQEQLPEEDDEDDEDEKAVKEDAAKATDQQEAEAAAAAALREQQAQALPEALRRCLAVLQELIWQKESSHFLYAVDPKIHPDYYNTVRHPMSLNDIQSALLNGKYASVSEFLDECRLMFDNCRCYNHETSQVIQVLYCR